MLFRSTFSPLSFSLMVVLPLLVVFAVAGTLSAGDDYKPHHAVNAKNPRGHTVLYCAGGHGHLDCLLLLLKEGADRDTQVGLMEWLNEYPDDWRFRPIAEALRQHMAGG